MWDQDAEMPEYVMTLSQGGARIGRNQPTNPHKATVEDLSWKEFGNSEIWWNSLHGWLSEKQFWIFQESSRNTGKPLPGLDRLALWELRRLKAKSIKRAWCSSYDMFVLHRPIGRTPTPCCQFFKVQCRIFFRAASEPCVLGSLKSVGVSAAWMTWYEVSAYCLEQCSHVETLDDVGFNNLKLHMVRQRKYVLWLGDLWDGDLFQSIKGTYFPQWRWISSWNVKGLTCGLYQPMLWWKRALL